MKRGFAFVLALVFVLTSCGSDGENESDFCFDLPATECGEHSECERGRFTPWNDADSCWDTQKPLCVPKGFSYDPNTGCPAITFCFLDPDGGMWTTPSCIAPSGWEPAERGACTYGPSCE